MSTDLTIVYATQTGNAAMVAEWTLAAAQGYVVDVRLRGMDEMTAADWQGDALVIISTTGEGAMPDMALSVWQHLQQAAPNLRGMRFALLALGDSLYDYFCQAGKDWDARLAELGAKRLAERTDCDVEFEADARAWIDARLQALAREHGWQKREVAQAEAPPGYSREQALTAVLRSRRVLSGARSLREVVHCELEMPAQYRWQAGDLLYVLPENPEPLVDAALQILNARAADRVYWRGHYYALGDLLRTEVELRLPGRDFLRALGMECARGDVLDCLRAGIVIDTQDAVEALEPIRARVYSIASAQDILALTVGRVQFESRGKSYRGIASNWLADLPPGAAIRGWLARNVHFHLPEDDEKAIIMVATGTGIAPFRGFMQAREARAAKGGHWLFFGDRYRDSDFLYREEWQAWQASGLLDQLSLAFSREQAEKFYVQDALRAQGAEVFAWLENGACLYVCGSPAMAKDVESAVHEIIAKHGNMCAADAAAYVARLKNDKRYCRDVY